MKTVDLRFGTSVGEFSVTCSAFSDEVSSKAPTVVDSLGSLDISEGALKLNDSVTSSAVDVLESPLLDTSSEAGAASVGSLLCDDCVLNCSICCCSVTASLAASKSVSLVGATPMMTLAVVTIGCGSAAVVSVTDNGMSVNADVTDSSDWDEDGTVEVIAGPKLWLNFAVLNAGKELKVWLKAAAFIGTELAVVGTNLADAGVELKKGCINKKNNTFL